jgi:hypothetical protein
MKLFEIHITGKDDSILKEFENLGLKTLSINLLDSNHNIVGNEYMCCVQKKFKTYEECQDYVGSLLLKLKSKVVRVKIESAYYKEYVDKAIYAETHFVPTIICINPTVYNIKSKKHVSTIRTYDKSHFEALRVRSKRYLNNAEFELCLYDSNPKFDDYWLSFYKK